MKNIVRGLLSVLLVLAVVFCVVACKGDAPSSTEPEKPDTTPKVLTTKFFMPKGWNQETPVWKSKDEGTVNVPAPVVSGDGEHEVTNVTEELKTALAQAVATDGYFKDVKNIIIIIGDGMGVSHVQASENYSGELIMTQLPYVGISTTLTREGETTDSAAGGTAISAGYKTTKSFAAMDAEGNELVSVSELARNQGKLVGLVSNANLLDATLAAFSVHNKNRSQGWTKIGEQEIVFGPDLFMGTDRNDDYNTNEFSGKFASLSDFVEKNNIKKYTGAAKMISQFDEDIRMWAIFTSKGLDNRLARYDYQNDKHPNLQQMASFALTWLDEHDKGDGFLLMIENTYTDHFGHGNDPTNTADKSDKRYGIVKEVQSTDEVVAIALEYVLTHPDTALIVTADHETGGITLLPGWETNFAKMMSTSGSHTSQNVPVFAIGKGTEKLNTLSNGVSLPEGMDWYDFAYEDNKHPEYADYWYENAHIGQIIGKLLGVEDYGGNVATDNSSKRIPKFDVTVKTATNELVFTLDFMGVPLHDDELVQFKIQPVHANDTIKLELEGKEEALFETAAFSSAKDGDSLSPAYKYALDTTSGSLSGWYQFSIKAGAESRKIKITLRSGSGTFMPGDVIHMDDFTIGYASTYGWLKFSSDNATATGDCLYVEN